MKKIFLILLAGILFLDSNGQQITKLVEPANQNPQTINKDIEIKGIRTFSYLTAKNKNEAIKKSRQVIDLETNSTLRAILIFDNYENAKSGDASENAITLYYPLSMYEEIKEKLKDAFSNNMFNVILRANYNQDYFQGWLFFNSKQ